MITYNHEEFIRGAIESVLMQKCDFKIELIIADDNSPDNTQDIVEESILKNSKKNIEILYTKHSQNKGMTPNFNWALNQCKSKYIALCDGDDYWTDPLKLQKQVNFLEGNPDAIGCFHNSVCVDETGKVVDKSYFKKTDKKKYNQEECLKLLKCSYSTASLVFRSLAIKDKLDQTTKIASDFILDLVITNHGDLFYLDENMSAYRIHSGGIWQGNAELNNVKVILSRFLFLINTEPYRTKYYPYLWKRTMNCFRKLISLSKDEKDKNIYKREQYSFLDYSEFRTYKFLFKKLNDAFRYRVKLIFK